MELKEYLDSEVEAASKDPMIPETIFEQMYFYKSEYQDKFSKKSNNKFVLEEEQFTESDFISTFTCLKSNPGPF